MIKRKLKKCNTCHEDKYLFSNGMCMGCWVSANPNRIKQTPIVNKVSGKQKERNKRYLKLREAYLKDNSICECCKHFPANQIHHKRGRIGDNLFNHFVAICENCHRGVEENPGWARSVGLIESRLNGEEDDHFNSSGG